MDMESSELKTAGMDSYCHHNLIMRLPLRKASCSTVCFSL